MYAHIYVNLYVNFIVAERVGFSGTCSIIIMTELPEPGHEYNEMTGEPVCYGEGEIRTHDTLSGIPFFENGLLNHSSTSPFTPIPISFLIVFCLVLSYKIIQLFLLAFYFYEPHNKLISRDDMILWI